MDSPLHLFSPDLPAPAASLKLRAGLGLLLEAHCCAGDLRRDPWQYGVEIDALQAAGLTNSQLRRLLDQGYLRQARETTRCRSGRRTFREAGNLGLGPQSCFVLTEE